MGKFGLFLLRVEEDSKSTGITGRGKLLGWKMLQEERGGVSCRVLEEKGE